MPPPVVLKDADTIPEPWDENSATLSKPLVKYWVVIVGAVTPGPTYPIVVTGLGAEPEAVVTIPVVVVAAVVAPVPVLVVVPVLAAVALAVGVVVPVPVVVGAVVAVLVVVIPVMDW